jgi:hypothetical protein
MARDTIIRLAFLRECFECDSATGTLTWKRRPREHFASAWAWGVWNARFAGKPAGHPYVKGYLGVHLTFDGKKHTFGRRISMPVSAPITRRHLVI